ncbi:hypothetical protein ACROYT_G018888 [Oculina patagonica]
MSRILIVLVVVYLASVHGSPFYMRSNGLQNCKTCMKNPERCSTVDPCIFTTCLQGTLCCRCNCNRAICKPIP